MRKEYKIEDLNKICKNKLIDDQVRVFDTWQEYVLGLMAEGWSVTEIISSWKMTRENYGKLRKENIEFAEVFEDGEQLCEAWWLSLGRLNILNQKSFHMGIYAFHMKNRFGWRDSPLSQTEKSQVIPDKTKQQEIVSQFKLVKSK